MQKVIVSVTKELKKFTKNNTYFPDENTSIPEEMREEIANTKTATKMIGYTSAISATVKVVFPRTNWYIPLKYLTFHTLKEKK